MSGSGSGVKVILGAMEFGREARETHEEGVCHALVQQFVESGFDELDTAIMYTGGESEKILGRLPPATRESVHIATKVNPWQAPFKSLTAESIRAQFDESLASLQAESVDMIYLHAPDHATEVTESLRVLNEEYYAKGKFKRLGLSNYAAWQVVEIYYISKANGWVLPSVYQGMYNALTRAVEPELFPALRRLGMAFYAYNPLCGGVLTGRYQYSDVEDKQPTGRFFGNSWAAKYRERFWHKCYFDAVDGVRAAIAEAYGEDGDAPTLVEASLRFLMHHSALKGEHGDGLILGVSSTKHTEQNLRAVAQGPLHELVVKAFNDGWDGVLASGGKVPCYFR